MIIITYDESERQDGQVPANGLGDGGHTVLAGISPLVTPGDYSTTTYAYGVLRTLQDAFGLAGYLGHAADVSALNVWGR